MASSVGAGSEDGSTAQAGIQGSSPFILCPNSCVGVIHTYMLVIYKLNINLINIHATSLLIKSYRGLSCRPFINEY